MTVRVEETAQALTAAVVTAIARMREQLGKPQELREIARTAYMSKFHFHRVFRNVTAATPGRFLTALKIAEAQHLLLETTMNATEISTAVGYSSFGTFTTQFNRLTGLPPGRFRVRAAEMADLTMSQLLAGYRKLPGVYRRGAAAWVGRRPDQSAGVAVVGIFPSRIPQEPPIACLMMEPPGPARFPEVAAAGTFEVLAVSVAADATVRDVLAASPKAGLYVGTADNPLYLGGASRPPALWIALRKPLVTDPPLLTAFPLLMTP